MSALPFRARVHGKWILAGEHAVLRGCPALVFPMLSRSLTLSYRDDGQTLRAEFSGEFGAEIGELFLKVLARAREAQDHVGEVTGHFTIANSLPIGAGLGASAALCVAVARWCESQGWVKESELYEFARGLEDLFHGESSGVDVAVALSGKGLRFERSGARASLAPAWSPSWFLSYSGARGLTAECVTKVKALFETDRPLAERIDAQMREAVTECETALASPHSEQGFETLARAMHKARGCFESWGLAGGAMGDHLSRLMAAGAASAKPTGSGGGGFALSLWRNPPSSEVTERLGFPLLATDSGER